MRRTTLWMSALLLAALCGCDGTSKIDGKVTYHGRPVLSGSVIALHDDGTARSGVIQPDGTYAVEGVKKGRVRFGVLSPDPAHARSILTPKETAAKGVHFTGKGKPAGWFALPHSLGDPATSGLGCDVSKSRTHFDLDLN
jgi:hypothetical protein